MTPPTRIEPKITGQAEIGWRTVTVRDELLSAAVFCSACAAVLPISALPAKVTARPIRPDTAENANVPTTRPSAVAPAYPAATAAAAMMTGGIGGPIDARLNFCYAPHLKKEEMMRRFVRIFAVCAALMGCVQVTTKPMDSGITQLAVDYDWANPFSAMGQALSMQAAKTCPNGYEKVREAAKPLYPGKETAGVLTWDIRCS